MIRIESGRIQRNRIVVFMDYRSQFYSALLPNSVGMKTDELKQYFEAAGYSCNLRPFSCFDPLEDFKDAYVLYQSSEDRDQFYKHYIDDIILTISRNGGALIPRHECFVAHENKGFQAFLTSGINKPGLIIPKSTVYGCLEDFRDREDEFDFPVVVKRADGCQSKAVRMARNKNELYRTVKEYSSSFNFNDFLRFTGKRVLRKGYIPESLHRRKVVVQQFVPDLPGDYKVLVYGDKEYVLQRKNRPNDFRASGSHLFSYSEDIAPRILNSARALREHFDCPFLSADIGYNARTDECYLLEIQFLMFGTYTLEKSPFYFQYEGGSWRLIREKSVLEDVVANTVLEYIKNSK